MDPSLLKLYAELGMQTVPIDLAEGTMGQKVSRVLTELLEKAMDTNS